MALAPVQVREGPEGPYVGAPPPEGRVRFSAHRPLERLLQELRVGFGPQRWWPARSAFEVAVGAVLVQNTNWHNAQLALERLRAGVGFEPAALAHRSLAELEPEVRPAGFFRAKSDTLRTLAAFLAERGGCAALGREPTPSARRALLALRGVGPETADAILAFAAGHAVPIASTYARRLLGRHGLLRLGATYAEARAWLDRHLLENTWVRQEAHALCVRAGYGNCKPEPDCGTCPATTPPPRG